MAQATAKKKKVAAAAKEISQTNQPKNEVVIHLQQQVANAFVLYANYKHYHWQTYGPLFRDLHLMFYEFATVDELAERIRIIGQYTVTRLEDILATASLPSAQTGQSMKAMMREGDNNVIMIINEMREAIKTASEHDDFGTADTLTRFLQIHEKHEWWQRDILEKRDGLTD